MPNNTFQQILSKKEKSLKKDVETKNSKPLKLLRFRSIKPDESNSRFELISQQEQLEYFKPIQYFRSIKPDESNSRFELISQQEQLNFENQINFSRLNEYIPQTNKLLQLIKETDFEYGVNSPVDDFLVEKLQQNAIVTKQWLNQIFIKNFNDVDIVTGILRTIAHLPYYKIYPQGMTMALAALSHKNPEVRECGIRSFENWRTLESLNVLKDVHASEPWLQNYISQVISDLEEDLA